MGADPSAYAALGLEPGADAAAVQQAYKKLIKEHHPDRSGGDSKRAVEINRAYQQLRSALHIKDEFSLHPVIARRSAAGWSPTVWAAILLLVLGGAAAILKLVPLPTAVNSGEPDRKTGSFDRHDVMTRPLAIPGIDAAVVEAVRISRTGDEMRLTTASRQCHSTFRLKPELEQFDRCAAFDDAVVRLQDRDPLRDRGAFSQIAVSGRLWSAAAYLSGDYLATDSRLQRIRIRVETLLSGDGRIIGGAS